MEKRRSTDGITIAKIGSIGTSIVILLGALVLIGSTVFAKVEDVEKLECKVDKIENTQIRTVTQLENISDGIKEIKKMIKR